MIDMESTTGKPQCYSKSASAMVAWIQDFVNTYHTKMGRYPMIYTNRDWWKTCTGNSDAFSQTCPLVFASWGSAPGPVLGQWPSDTIWQNSDHFVCGGDSDLFNGDIVALKKFAKGS
jgi:GH25 family lysozyme M1 (1,4-beta-N-acetylmuramidase)